MKINITGDKIQLTEAIQAYIETKVNNLKKFINAEDDQIIVHVIVGKTSTHHNKGDYFKAEIKLNAPHHNFVTETEKDDLYAAIDAAHDTIKKEILKNKEKILTSHQK